MSDRDLKAWIILRKDLPVINTEPTAFSVAVAVDMIHIDKKGTYGEWLDATKGNRKKTIMKVADLPTLEQIAKALVNANVEHAMIHEKGDAVATPTTTGLLIYPTFEWRLPSFLRKPA